MTRGQHFVGENIKEGLDNGLDYVVIGEGEETVVELLDALRGERDPATIAGLAFLRDGRTQGIFSWWTTSSARSGAPLSVSAIFPRDIRRRLEPGLK